MLATEAARADKFVGGFRVNLSKTSEKGSTTRQKRKVAQQPTVVSQRNLRSGLASSGANAPQQDKVFATNRSEAKRAGTVVTGMDWLATNHDSINCSCKKVVFNPPTGTSFKFKGVGTVVLPKVISAMKASKLLNQDTLSILESMVDIREVDVSLTSEPVVRDYPDVFPKELLGLPPHNEIDFAIEVKPDIVPISRAPHRITPTELKELKIQLQEFFDKAKIEAITSWPRPSTISEVRRFLGLADYYRCKACEDSFQNLKQKLVTTLVLIIPDGSKSFVIYSDASKKGLGCVQMQQEGVKLRQRRWLKLVKDYDCEILYHLGKANVVANAHSRKAFMCASRRAVKTDLLTEAHSFPFSMHIGLPKTLKGYIVIWVVVDRLTKSAYFIPGKSTYTASKWAQLYLTEIVRLHGMLVLIVSDKYACFTSMFWKRLKAIMGTIFQATIVMAPFEALYGKCCRSPICWDEVDKVFLKVAHMKGVLRFEKKENLSPHFVGPFEIPEQVGRVAYCLALPPSLSTFHDVFHVSMLRKYVVDPFHVVDYKPLEIDENLSYVEQLVEILVKEAKMLRNRGIGLIKVLWQDHQVEEATWEREDDMTACYPELFKH
ncbi:pol protein [Cucumis melo var. makuwa]|uniref:Pol protein n=1 Tax=Cucumis melo var. makuwa TaxID=1194695 RepID=A0A5A7UY63_CUCMM|nr:pol protein [Cucumis melo var. makuwa]